MKEYSLLKELLETHAVSSFEEPIAKIIERELQEHSSEIMRDKLGSIICVSKKSDEKKNVMIIAHMDEVGFMIKSIKSDGTLSLFSLGSVNLISVIGMKVKIISTNENKVFKGIIVASDLNKINLDTIYVDMCYSSYQDVIDLGVRIGDQVALDTVYEQYNDRIIANSLDDRVSCSIGIEVFKELSKKVNYNLFFVGSVQEEVGTRGAKTSISMVNPDLCIVLDVASPRDSLYHREKSRFLGKGPCICMADRTAIGDKIIISRFVNLAEKYSIPFQYDFLSGGGTDAGAVQKYGYGVRTMALITPVRYCHTAHSMVSISDYDNTKLLLQYFLLSLNEEFIE